MRRKACCRSPLTLDEIPSKYFACFLERSLLHAWYQQEEQAHHQHVRSLSRRCSESATANAATHVNT